VLTEYVAENIPEVPNAPSVNDNELLEFFAPTKNKAPDEEQGNRDANVDMSE